MNVKRGVRERSIPLEHSECHKVKVGDLVLCFQVTFSLVFFFFFFNKLDMIHKLCYNHGSSCPNKHGAFEIMTS